MEVSGTQHEPLHLRVRDLCGLLLTQLAAEMGILRRMPHFPPKSSWFHRYLLPGLAFKAVVIGGGYATGRELAEFFLPSGPRGGLLAIALVMMIWSVVCAVTFCLARATASWDYRTFFKNLLGPFWVIFEGAYLLFIILILAVFGAAAGAIAAAVLNWPSIMGTSCLIACISLVCAYGSASVERLFKWVSIVLYGVYGLFVVLSFHAFGDRIVMNLAAATPTSGWMLGGLTYAGYNVVGAVIVLPVLRHVSTHKEAIIAGLLAGPLAMIPALLFFICMIAFAPQIGSETLPSDFLLLHLKFPAFHVLFQFMIFLALLETGGGLEQSAGPHHLPRHRYGEFQNRRSLRAQGWHSVFQIIAERTRDGVRERERGSA